MTRYTAAELAAMLLPGLPTSKSAVLARARAENWPYEEQTGVGGRSRYFAVPDDVAALIAQRNAVAVVASKPLHPVAQPTLPGITTDQQQLVADARAGIVQQIELMQARSGYSLDKSCAVLLDMARTGQASPQLVAMLRHARDTRGKKSARDDGLPSVRSLRRFVERRESGSLIPAVRERDMSVPAWAQAFLDEYQTPQKRSVAYAYELFETKWAGPGTPPSVHAVRRWLDKVGSVSLQTGRMGPRELKSLKSFVKRDFAQLLPGDIYTADGHQFDAQVAHPFHGQAWRPEVTSVVDVATRRIVGFSVALAESGFAVLDAIRAAVTNSGVPAILYVDNGSGYVNHMMTDEAVGLMGRLGIQMHHSLPYNSQARGVIERLHSSVWVKAAKLFATYLGADMDPEARKTVFKITRAMVKRGDVTSSPLMSFVKFIEFCNAIIAAYNARPHRSLPRIVDPVTGKRRHQTPDESLAAHAAAGWTPVMLTDAESDSLFRPRHLCAIRRCWIRLFGNDYYSALLDEHHGEDLPVGYDIHDPAKVWVYDDAGRLICTAGLDENKRPYMPQSVVERARDTRADAREKRILNQLDDVRAERHGRPAIEHQDVTLPGLFGNAMSRELLAERAAVLRAADAEIVHPEPVATPAVDTSVTWSLPATPPARRAEWARLNEMSPEQRDALGAHAVSWHAMYPSSAEYRAGTRKTA